MSPILNHDISHLTNLSILSSLCLVTENQYVFTVKSLSNRPQQTNKTNSFEFNNPVTVISSVDFVSRNNIGWGEGFWFFNQYAKPVRKASVLDLILTTRPLRPLTTDRYFKLWQNLRFLYSVYFVTENQYVCTLKSLSNRPQQLSLALACRSNGEQAFPIS
jgi:hypothetical protein